jgi:hypothetical protein
MPYRHYLDLIRVADPCREAWDRTEGDERVRTCGACRNDVYALRLIAPDEIDDLVWMNEGERVARFAQRGDGTIVVATSECRAATRAKRRRLIARERGSSVTARAA